MRFEDEETPLCCCEYFDKDGERNHILTCCCNCIELDLCCDRLVSCKPVSGIHLKKVMRACLDRVRCPGRGGAFSPLFLSYTIIAPFLLQPLLAIACVLYVHNIAVITSLFVVLQVLMSCYMAKHNAHSQILYYWTLSAILYSLILFESSVIPLLEIRWDENVVVVILGTVSLGCFYLTRCYSLQNGIVDRSNGSMVGNGAVAESVCPVCRIKVYPRCVHCSVCQTCVSRYDHHCFWLDCCIGENNQQVFMAGCLFGILALVYGSMLTLTTVCRPVFKYGILVPIDCSDVADDLELGLCYLSAVYCMGLSVALALQLLHHFWLVSRGISGEEWRLQRYSLCANNPYSRGCCRNWVHLFRGANKMRR